MRARGFTLIELMIALTIALIGVAAGVTLMIGTQHWFQGGVDDRGMQETARVALGELEMHLKSAGLGMEPTIVFDTGVLAPTSIDRIPPGLGPPRFGGYGCGGAGQFGLNCAAQRDRVDGPDELVFYATDPLWHRRATQVNVGGPITLGPSPGKATDLKPGQVLEVMCEGASNQWLWAFVTIATVNASNQAAVVVTLRPSPGQDYDFPFQNAMLSQGCYRTASAVHVYKVDRYRYHVAAIDDAGQVRAWGTPGIRPYLMLDQGLFDADGTPIDQMVTPDVEDLQVAYVFPLANGAQVLGATKDQLVTVDTAGVDDGVFNLAPEAAETGYVIPSFSTPPSNLDLARRSHHPANVRAVRVALTIRASRQDDSAGSLIPAALNRHAVNGEAGFRRAVVETTVYVRNLEMAAPVFPQYDPTGMNGNVN